MLKRKTCMCFHMSSLYLILRLVLCCFKLNILEFFSKFSLVFDWYFYSEGLYSCSFSLSYLVFKDLNWLSLRLNKISSVLLNLLIETRTLSLVFFSSKVENHIVVNSWAVLIFWIERLSLELENLVIFLQTFVKNEKNHRHKT